MTYTSYRELLAAARDGEPHYGTREVLNTALAVDDNVLKEAVARPGSEPLIGAAEGLLLVAGLQSKRLLEGVQPRFADYADGGSLEGAYGPRLRAQLQGAHRKLQTGSGRQASAVVWRPEDSLEDPPPRDVPCTLAVSFHLRKSGLHMMVAMRSNDAWMGLPYDLVMFRMLHLSMAAAVGAPAGGYLHVSSSTHVYARDLGKEADWRPASSLPRWLGPASPIAGWRSQVQAARNAVELVSEEESASVRHASPPGSAAMDALAAALAARRRKVRG